MTNSSFEKGFTTKREVKDIVRAEITDKFDDIVIDIIDEQKNEPNGLAGLDINGKISISQMPGGVPQLQSQSWDASTNTPNLLTIEKQTSFTWFVGIAGNTNLSGITDWQNGDYAIYLGNNTFGKIDNTDNTSLQILNNLSDLNNKTTARTNLDVYSTSQVDTALNTKENNIASGTVSQYWRGDKTFQTLDKNAVGLANVDNTSDANKPVSTATQTALNLKADKVVGAVANNFASLNSAGNLIDSGKKSSDFEPADTTILKEEDVINNLTSTDTNKPLSANQGKVLQDNKANKVSGATNGNFASLNSSGDLVDSTKKPSDFEPADVNILKKSNVIDNLTSTNIDLPLSANQGKVLQDGKVDKITGKGLSTNDFDNTYKAQLDNFTENSQDAVASALTDTATIDLTYNDELNQITADVKDGSINNVKIGTNADISTSKIKQAVITPQIGTFSNNDTQDVINNKAQGQITNLENLINTRPIGASNGSVYYLTSQASAIPNYELLSFSPDNSPLDVESITITSATPKIDRLFHSYISTYEVGNTIINGGNWIFNFYGYTSHIDNNNFEIDVYKRDSSGTETLLFTCNTSNLLQTSQISPELNVANVEITNQDFSCNTTDKIVVKIYAKTDRSVATTITLLHSGTDYASHIHTPIIATHNQLAGTQGGSATEKYHLILSDYNKVLALDTSFSLKEDVANKTTAFSATPANIKYPTEKLVKDNLDLKEDLSNKATSFSITPADVKYPTEKLVKDNLDLKENLTNKASTFSLTPNDTKYPTEKLVKDNLDLKGNITDTRQESTRFVEKTYGLDTNDGLTIFEAFKTPERGWTDVNPSGQVKIIGGAEHTVNHTFASSKQSIKTILDNGAKISGTINLVSGNTSMQFFDGKISATINDNSTGTCYFNGVDLSGSIINFNGGGYKYIANSSSAPTLINFANLSGGATATATLININGGAISIGDGWTIIKTNSTLAITSKSSSAVLYDSNFFVINAVITSQVALNVVLSSGLAGLYIVNFASPTGITGISKGDIIYRVGGNNVIVNKFFDAPSSVSVANGISFDTWIKQANDNWVIGSISSSSRLDASNIADGSISNTEFQYLNNVSSNIQTQLDGKLNTTLKGANNGLAELDSTGKVPSSQLPAYVDDVLEFDNFASFPATGEAGKIYVAKDTNIVYRWGGTQYIEISSSLALGETSSTAYRGDRGKIAYDHSQTTGNPHSTTKGDIGLGNVDNTSDADKPISSATQTALNSKEPTITAGTTSQYYRGDKTFQTLDKNSVGLSNVANIDTTTTANITDSTDKRFVSDVEKTILSNTSGTNTGDETTLSIQTKRPLKTVSTQSLEGSGNISLSKSDVGLNNVDNTADANKNVLSATKLTTARNINGVSFDGTANITIADNTKEPAFTKNTAFNKNFGTTTGTVAEGNDARLGTKNIDETNIANNRIQVYNSTSGKLEYQDKPVGSTNLAIANKTSTTLDITSDTGNDATIPEATNTQAGLLSASDKVKLNNTSGTNTGDETTTTIQTKRPLKTISSKSLEGSGDVSLSKSDVGLSNVDNTSDADKPISSATQTALNQKEATITAGTVSQYYRGDKTFQTLDKNAVGLSNVVNADTTTTTNITDSTNKRFITDTQRTVLSNTSGTNTGDQDLSGLMVKAQNLGDVANRQTSLNNLTDVANATNEYVLTKDTATGNAIWKVAQGGGGDITTQTFIQQTNAPTNPTSGKNKLYFKTDGNLYKLDDAGNENEIGSGSSGSTILSNGDANYSIALTDAEVINTTTLTAVRTYTLPTSPFAGKKIIITDLSNSESSSAYISIVAGGADTILGTTIAFLKLFRSRNTITLQFNNGNWTPILGGSQFLLDKIWISNSVATTNLTIPLWGSLIGIYRGYKIVLEGVNITTNSSGNFTLRTTYTGETAITGTYSAGQEVDFSSGTVTSRQGSSGIYINGAYSGMQQPSIMELDIAGAFNIATSRKLVTSVKNIADGYIYFGGRSVLTSNVVGSMRFNLSLQSYTSRFGSVNIYCYF